MTLLRVEDLSVAYPGASRPVVAGLGLTVDPGDALGIVGESGSGKTQAALAIMGLLPAHARVTGSVRCDGSELLGQGERLLNRFRARRIAMVFQDPGTALNPCLTIGQQLRRVLLEHRLARRDRLRRVTLDLLDRVRLPDPERQLRSYPHQLSGGMRQRALIALALAAEPGLIIADEPTTALDVTVQAEILALLRELRAGLGLALVLITHDLGVIAQNAERMLVMQRGRLLEQGRTQDLFRNPSHPHTREMIRAAPRLDEPGPATASGPEPPVPLLDVENVSVSFKDARRGRLRRKPALPAVTGVSLVLGRGETLAIVGESGSGKTTLARAIVGLVRPDAGRVTLNGAALAAELGARSPDERRRVQMVFQDPVASLDPAMQVRDILAEPLRLRRPHAEADEKEVLENIRELLRRVRLDEALLERAPHELSGGQAQRVAIARALAVEPLVLICDEAVAALDARVRRQILELLRAEQAATGLSLIFITHDLAVVRQFGHRVVVMYAGRVCEVADNRSLFAHPRHPYTRALMDAVPVPDPAVLPRAGAGPRAAPAGGGCDWRPRCPHAIARCETELPALRATENGLTACHRMHEIDLRRSE